MIDIYSHRNGNHDEYSLGPAPTRDVEIIAVITCLNQALSKPEERSSLGFSLESSFRRLWIAQHGFCLEVENPNILKKQKNKIAQRID